MSEGFDIRLPNLTEGDEKEQLRQIRSYLYQLAGQLQFALRGAATPVSEVGSQPMNGLSFGLIKKQLLRSPEVADALSSKIRRQLESAFQTKRLAAERAEIAQLQMGEYCIRVDEAGHCSLI